MRIFEGTKAEIFVTLKNLDEEIVQLFAVDKEGTAFFPAPNILYIQNGELHLNKAISSEVVVGLGLKIENDRIKLYNGRGY